MKKKRRSNIFDEAGKKRENKKAKSSSSNAIEDKETEEMLQRLRNMDEDLQNKMGKICELSGMTKDEITRYMENPSNFPETKWRKAQREKESLEEKVYAAIGIGAKKQQIKKKKKKLAKGRRGKTLGARKGWIQM